MRKNIFEFIKNKFIRGGLILIAANFFGGFLNYVFNSLSAKLLGPSGYGEITALFSYLAIFSIPFAVFTTDIIRRLGDKGKNRLFFFKSGEIWFWGKLYHWRYFLALSFLISYILPKFTNLSLLFSLTLIILVFLNLIGTVYNAGLQSMHFFSAFSLISIIAVAIKLLGPVLVFFHIDNLSIIAFFLVLSSISGILLSKYFVDNIIKNKKIRTISIKKRITSLAFNQQIIITSFSLISLNLINNFDVVFVKKNFAADLAGIYSAWNLFAKIIFYILSPLLSLFYIFITSTEEKKRHKKILFISSLMLIISGFVLFFVYKYYGNTIFLFIFNKDYASIVELLPFAAISGIAFSLITLFNSAFLAKNSKLSLLSIIFVIFYIIILLTSGKTLRNIVMINVTFSLLIAVSYFAATFLKTNGSISKSQ